jgi:hypothetical protein
MAGTAPIPVSAGEEEVEAGLDGAAGGEADARTTTK